MFKGTILPQTLSIDCYFIQRKSFSQFVILKVFLQPELMAFPGMTVITLKQLKVKKSNNFNLKKNGFS